jgi:hypothetical protein
MRPRSAKTMIFATISGLAAFSAGCGQTVQGTLPDLPRNAAPASTVLTPEEAKTAADALIRARDERHARDLAALETRKATSP